jgi:hypothetical protein
MMAAVLARWSRLSGMASCRCRATSAGMRLGRRSMVEEHMKVEVDYEYRAHTTTPTVYEN